MSSDFDRNSTLSKQWLKIRTRGRFVHVHSSVLNNKFNSFLHIRVDGRIRTGNHRWIRVDANIFMRFDLPWIPTRVEAV